MRSGFVVLLLGAWCLGAEPRLKDLFDPGSPRFPLTPYGWEEWDKLPRKAKMRSKGVDPATWSDPPPDPPDPNEPKKPPTVGPTRKKPAGPKQYPKDRYPGFRFDRRLNQKQQAFQKLTGDNPPPSVVDGLIKRLARIEKDASKFDKRLLLVTEDYSKLKEQVDNASDVYIRNYKKRFGKPPDEVMLPRSLLISFRRQSKELQRVISVQQSERVWQGWVVGRVGDFFAALNDEEMKKPLAALQAGMKGRNWAHKIRCGAILGRSGSQSAVALFEAALDKEQDPLLLGELIRIRIKRGGNDLMPLLAKRLDDPAWPVRLAVIRQLANVKTKESVDLLIARLAKEDGRLKDDIRAALVGITGKRMDPDFGAWDFWWKKTRSAWSPPPVVKTKGEAGKEGKGVYFYGIRTSSKRIVFCIDVSGSMAFPLDGQGGKKPPRIERAKKELFQALRSLPEDAQFAIVAYNSRVGAWKKGRMQPATVPNKQSARKYVEKLDPAGATNIFDALDRSMAIARTTPKRDKHNPSADTIFFLTDGLPTHGKIIDPHQILEEITARNGLTGIVIHTVGVSKDQNAGFLLNLAKRNGGRYVAHK